MSELILYPAGTTEACCSAARCLKALGASIIDHPTPEITHLLLDVPSFSIDGTLRGGGDLRLLLQMLPTSVTVIGGNLTFPLLKGYRCIDLLQNETYLSKNAAITASCTLGLAAKFLDTAFFDTPTLVIGWGRIGKCLAQMLHGLGTPVTVAARREESRAMLQALGYKAISMEEVPALLPRQKLLINTAPEPILDATALSRCLGCVKLDLASRQGIFGDGVLWARGLPGKYAPESSGRLIAETVYKEVTL